MFISLLSSVVIELSMRSGIAAVLQLMIVCYIRKYDSGWVNKYPDLSVVLGSTVMVVCGL